MPVLSSLHCPTLPSLLLTLLLGFTGTAGEEFQVNQPEGSVSVRAGDIVTLACNMSAHSPAGPVLWFRKNGPEQQLIYSFNGSHFPRVNQVENTEVNQTDYSIRISDVSPKDTGTYYCVKLTIGHPDMAYVSGSGTYVSVNDAGTYYCVKFKEGQPDLEFQSGPGTEVFVTRTSSHIAPGAPERHLMTMRGTKLRKNLL
ncbi:signal-regulatory protein beta-1-like isoform X3 [Neofelis nebulosa]|uniref:signal-regulatory protein beta-1-like isoform X3 n=1 Tax=Neofelis nebulosa TaxID=61452 RepID=UPI00272C9A86|nr:signal-regulatory protein beta-1-like isoform X3 [Neofelis nebulosa]